MIPIINPAHTSEVVGHIREFSAAEVDAALTAAVEAGRPWAAAAPEERAERLTLAADALSERIPQLATLFVRENGKPLREAERDIQRSIELMRLIAADLAKWWTPELYEPTQPVWARRRARGVTVVISPWNSPVLLSFKRFIPALAGGNPVIVKPATYCPLAVMECIRIMTPHFPAGVLGVVTGGGRTVGEQLAADARVRTIAFTGSTETGRRIMQLAAPTLKKLFLELGGNDPALILDDAELDGPAIERMTSAILRASGQVCVAIKRIYVHPSRYDELVDKLSAAFAAVVVGDGLNPIATMGPLNNRPQFEFVSALLEKCRAQGLQVLTRGRRLDPAAWADGYFMQPAIILGAGDDDDIVTCEQFGPVIPILQVGDDDEAVARANRSPFGLRASVWTGDRARAAALADRLEAGAVFHNNHGIFRDLHLEFPGLKQSGLSRESQSGGLDHYVDTYGFVPGS